MMLASPTESWHFGSMASYAVICNLAAREVDSSSTSSFRGKKEKESFGITRWDADEHFLHIQVELRFLDLAGEPAKM